MLNVYVTKMYYRWLVLLPPLPWLLLIFQQCVHIFACNFIQLLNNKIYTLTPSFVAIYLKMTKLCGFSQDNFPFLSVPSVVFPGCLLMAVIKPVCWWWDDDVDLKMDRVIADAQSDHHWQPQFGEVRHRLVECVLYRWSAGRLSTHQSS